MVGILVGIGWCFNVLVGWWWVSWWALGGVLMYWLAGGGYLDVGGHWVVF